MCAPCHQGEGSLHLAHVDGLPCDEFCSADVSPSPDISHPEFCPVIHIRRLTPDGRGGRFNFPGQTSYLEMKKHQFNFELVSVVINFVDYSSIKRAPARHELIRAQLVYRHQLGTNQMAVGKQLLETMCGGDFMSKNPEEAMDFLSYVAEVSRGWDEPHRGEVGKMKRVEELELKKMHEVQAVAETPVQVKTCSICQSYEHLVEECPTIPVAREMFGEQANVIGQFKPNSNASYGNTYNSSWRNHPNFSWKPRAPQYQQSAQPSQPSQQASSLEQAIVNLSKVVGDFVGDQKSINSQLIDFLLNLTKTPRVPTKWKIMRRIFTMEEEETKKREKMKGKKKDIVKGMRTVIQSECKSRERTY
ncbi:hypothetical protein AAG906_022141 [Vitis piasezkii]